MAARFHTLFLALSVTMSFKAYGHVVWQSDIAVKNEIPAWNSAMSQRYGELKRQMNLPLGYSECRMTVELENVVVCRWISQRHMNATLLRASTFVEGLNGDPNVVMGHGNRRMAEFSLRIGGHDLKGSDLLRFWQAVQIECQTNKVKCPNKHEEEFFNNVIARLDQEGEFVILAFAQVSIMPWEDAITHEILHAQYFMKSDYRAVVDAYWADDDNFRSGEKTDIKNALREIYNVDDDFLVRNEFQAYLLMARARFGLLGRFVQRHREKLQRKLTEAGVAPLQVSIETELNSKWLEFSH